VDVLVPVETGQILADEKVLEALGAARDRGADAAVLYHARNDEQKVSNEEAIQQFHLENICHPRNAQG